MKVAVLGSGLMGKEAARDLARSEGVTEIGLSDIDLDRAEQVVKNLKSSKLKAYRVDASNEEELKAFISQYDVVINALFYSFNEIVAKTAIEAGVHSVDLGDRKSTRLNSSHVAISYAVFCLKKKKIITDGYI